MNTQDQNWSPPVLDLAFLADFFGAAADLFGALDFFSGLSS